MSLAPALRAYTTITSTHWAMTPEYIELMADIALRENDPIEAVEKRLGRRLDNTREVTVRDGVATIPVLGPIFRYADFFTMISGGATVESIAQDLTVALDDPAVRSILLYIDSPGGEVNGINELGDMIFAARDSKPIVAYGSFLMASAAYWLGSAASRVVLDASALAGSIGVRTAVRDPSKVPSRTIEFISSQSPGKRSDPTTDAGRAQIQAEIDRLAEVFIGAVARNRGAAAERVIADFGRGGVLVGADAVAVGMADALGSYEGVLASLAAPSAVFFALPPISAAARGKEMPVTIKETTEPTTAPAAPPAASSEREDRLAALEAQLATERSARIAAEAETFAERQIRDHRMLPGEQAAWVALYQALAQDDASSPRAAGARVALLSSAFSARAPHDLTRELVPNGPAADPAGGPRVVTNPITTPVPDGQADLLKEADAHARGYAQRANGARKA
jgi:ClpP class serine protease